MSFQNKKLLFYISSLHWGGAETHIVRLLNELINIYSDVTIFIGAKGGVYEYLLDSRIKIIYGTYRGKLESNYSAFISTLKLGYVMRRMKPDLIFAMMDHVNISAIISRIIFRARGFLICGLHNTPSKKYYPDGKPQNKLRMFLMKRLYNYCDLIVACSQGVEVDFQTIFPNIRTSIKVLQNAAITDEILSYHYDENQVISRDLQRPIKLVACGRLIPQKGYTHLISSVKILSRSIKIKLTFIGDGPQRDFLLAYARNLNIEDSIHFTGYLKNPFELIAKSDFFVSSSLFEGNPQAILEAMAIGIPVIATDCDNGPREIINNLKNGMLVPVGDDYAISKAVLLLIDDYQLRKQISQQARHDAQARHAKAVAFEHATVFQNIV